MRIASVLYFRYLAGALPHVKLTKFATRTTPQGRYFLVTKAHASVDRFKFRRFGYGLRTVRTCKDGKAQERQVSKAFKLFLT